MSCCTNIISLGCFDSCQDISTGITATQTGTYVINVNDSAILEFSQISGQEIIIPGGYFNEDGKTTFQIIKPDGIALTDCYKVEILINYAQEAEASTSTVNVNGELLSTVLCGATKNIVVRYENGTATGTIIDNSTVEIPNPGACDDGTVENSDLSYSNTVASGGTLVLPDENFFFQIDGVTVATETEPALSTQTFNINWD